MPNIAAAATPVRPPEPARGQTQTQFAKQYLTPATQRVMPDVVLDARIGRGTVAGALNDQIRFRVERTGTDVDQWKLVPDSPPAAAIMQSTAGPHLLRQLRVAISSTGSLTEVSNLKGFILAKDAESVRAGLVLSRADEAESSTGRELLRHARNNDAVAAAAMVRQIAATITTKKMATVGAHNSRGWITFFPRTARTMLTAAGAYKPAPSGPDAVLREAAERTKYISGNAPHEVQHTISNQSIRGYGEQTRWIEEGVANVFTRTPIFHARNRRAAGLSAHAYAGRLAHDPTFDAGWKPWQSPSLSAKEQAERAKDVRRRYGDSQVVLRDLVRLAGADFRSTAGQERAFQLLQAQSRRFTPGVLADAIIAEHELDPSVRERLRTRIAKAVDIVGGAATIAKEFGIE